MIPIYGDGHIWSSGGVTCHDRDHIQYLLRMSMRSQAQIHIYGDLRVSMMSPEVRRHDGLATICIWSCDRRK